MSDALLGAARWLLHMAVGGGLLLLLIWFVVRWVRQPARQQRLAEWGVAASLVLAVLCLAPSWLLIPLPIEQPPAEPASVTPEAARGPQDQGEPAAPLIAERPPAERQEWVAAAEEPPAPAPANGMDEPAPGPKAGDQITTEAARVAPPPAKTRTGEVLLSAVVCLYFAGVAWFLARLALGYRHLSRLLRSAEEAPEEVRQLFDAMFPAARRPRLLVSRLVRVPLSCGLLRPTVVLPAALCEPEAGTQLRWVLAH